MEKSILCVAYFKNIVTTDERVASGLRSRDRPYIQILFFVKLIHSSVSVGIQFFATVALPCSVYILFLCIRKTTKDVIGSMVCLQVRNKVVFYSVCFRPSTRKVVTNMLIVNV